jgi:hypothetical protein
MLEEPAAKPVIAARSAPVAMRTTATAQNETHQIHEERPSLALASPRRCEALDGSGSPRCRPTPGTWHELKQLPAGNSYPWQELGAGESTLQLPIAKNVMMLSSSAGQHGQAAPQGRAIMKMMSELAMRILVP